MVVVAVVLAGPPQYGVINTIGEKRPAAPQSPPATKRQCTARTGSSAATPTATDRATDSDDESVIDDLIAMDQVTSKQSECLSCTVW